MEAFEVGRPMDDAAKAGLDSLRKPMDEVRLNNARAGADAGVPRTIE